MMMIFELWPDANKFRNLEFVDVEEGVELARTLTGKTIGTGWTRPRVRWLSESDNLRLPVGNFPSIGGIMPVVDAFAMGELKEVLTSEAEFLPLDCQDGDFFVVNVLRVIDILDETRSDVVRFSSGRVMRISRHAFYPDFVERLAGSCLFKIPQLLVTGIPYVTSDFVHASRRLKGMEFVEKS